jgi:putative transposase
LRGLMKKYPMLHIDTVNVDEDHLHLQMEIPPNMAVSKTVQVMKAELSIKLKRKFKFIRSMYLGGSIWSVGYFSSTVGLDEELIRRYIEYQGRQDIPQQVDFEFS